MNKNQTEWVFGIHALESVLEQSPENIIHIMVAENSNNPRLKKITTTAQSLGIKLTFESISSINKHCKDRHQGVIAQIKTLKLPDESDLKKDIESFKNPLVLVLDTIEDPRNLGACLRSADAAGVDLVIFPKHKAAGLTATARKTAAGAAETLRIYQVTNIVSALEILKNNGIWVAGTDCEADSKSIYQSDLTGALALVMGNEGKGIRPLVKKHCDFLVHIPMAGTVQSLNISVATGITLFEALRQRTQS
ncbi:MAG TPA: 23S rRNA (guanosine(2251)-2'-O)-methyltransferase RlmB [Gammaproteobacteria bacterium]|nr:23S rRNA (guanosine(2251)-2'-O)-methyltransferase RlmB [Gammaproteobacteria bacterium]HPI94941.1 23S rRNA (guanosine(2251)-2'-O)-methyltransferase RlmB [Gammaproteobacteria bacterium]HPQ86207.1 23S rRNA (guanosine(2251)-2'-O)-methyltransferase RlmB [Gammaproteobacteria bacterium]